MDLSLIPHNAILTPHHGEFTALCLKSPVSSLHEQKVPDAQKVEIFAKHYTCVVLLKGEQDIIGTPTGNMYEVVGGNAGMTKGGTGDVLAGLIAALACTNEALLSTMAGSFVNKKAGDALYAIVGPFFNATDLANQIPKTMKELLLEK